MDKPLSLLIVDVSNSWEDWIKNHERGYWIDDQYWKQNRFIREALTPDPLEIRYPHGTARAGLNAIVDTAKLVHRSGLTAYAVDMSSQWCDDELAPCDSLKPYVPKKNWYEKRSYSAFNAQHCALPGRIESDKCEHLLVIGYDRDVCVLETVKDAVARGIRVVTSDHCMLTLDRDDRRDASLAYFREHTTHLETLTDVWNYIHVASTTQKP